MSRISHFQAMSIHSNQSTLDKIEDIVPVFTYPEGGEIVVDTRMLDDSESMLTELSELLDVPRDDLVGKVLLIYV